MTTLSFTDRKGHSGLRSVWLDGRHTLIETAKLNGLDPQTWLTDKDQSQTKFTACLSISSFTSM
jgi:hypothetical protein